MSTNSKKPVPPVTVEDDEDVDDLDDVLDQFSAPAPAKEASASKSPSARSTTSLSSTTTAVPPPFGLPDDFSAELAAEMESFMKELAGEGMPDAAGSTADMPDDEKAFRDAFQKMLVSDLEATGLDGVPAVSSAAGPSAPTGSGQGFQEAIRETIERLKNTETSSKADAANSSDPLQAILSQLGMGDLSDMGGEGADGDVQGMLEGMMAQLMSKELLYEPMKELDEKYPEYLRDHTSQLSTEDVDRYKQQRVIIQQIVKEFEDPSYKDDDPEKSTKVLGLMNQMQALGSPPKEIMGDLPEGFQLGPDGMPNLDGPDGCTIS